VNYNVATAYLKNREYTQARTYYQNAIKIDPQKSDSYYNLAICEFYLGRKDVAADLLHRFLHYAPPGHQMRKDAQEKLNQLNRRRAP
jgi:Tfp pilus assembly protein PilF